MTPPTPEPRVHCQLSEVMGRHRLTQTALATAARLQNSTISALYHDRVDSISLVTLHKLVAGLRVLTGRAYSVGDLLVYDETHPNP